MTTPWELQSPQREWIAALEACGIQPSFMVLAALGHPKASLLIKSEISGADVDDPEWDCGCGEGPDCWVRNDAPKMAALRAKRDKLKALQMALGSPGGS